MARVTATEVKAICPTSVADLTPMIDAASLLVTEELGSSGLSSDRLTKIELYLAAHFVSVTDPRESQKSMGEASSTYEGRQLVAQGLNSTQYGRTALLLDTEGVLAQLGKTQASISLI